MSNAGWLGGGLRASGTRGTGGGGGGKGSGGGGASGHGGGTIGGGGGEGEGGGGEGEGEISDEWLGQSVVPVTVGSRKPSKLLGT